MEKNLITVLLLILAAAGCAPVAVEGVVEEPKPTGPGGIEVFEPTAQGEEQIVQPTSVDLSQITSEPAESGENVEVPAPRERNSEAKLIHDVSLDLSQRLGLDISEVALVESVKTTWPDGALGCPAEGISYTQAEVEGYQITLEAQGEEFVYHTNGLISFIWCDNGTPVQPKQYNE